MWLIIPILKSSSVSRYSRLSGIEERYQGVEILGLTAENPSSQAELCSEELWAVLFHGKHVLIA